jgi:hypothetical protein
MLLLPAYVGLAHPNPQLMIPTRVGTELLKTFFVAEKSEAPLKNIFPRMLLLFEMSSFELSSSLTSSSEKSTYWSSSTEISAYWSSDSETPRSWRGCNSPVCQESYIYTIKLMKSDLSSSIKDSRNQNKIIHAITL